MDIQLINKIENVINKMNSSQKTIARNILSSPNYLFTVIRGNIVIKEKNTNNQYIFVDYVKSKCNCD